MTALVSIETIVNGRPLARNVEPRMTLVEFLRTGLGLTGTKASCEMQVCGVCTVLVDDTPVSACTFLAADVDGRVVRTIEGLGQRDELHPVQRAFIDEYAMQCGFCTPGFVMMAVSLLEKNPHPTESEVVEYLDGNMCRCTGYRPIVDAVLRASEEVS